MSCYLKLTDSKCISEETIVSLSHSRDSIHEIGEKEHYFDSAKVYDNVSYNIVLYFDEYNEDRNYELYLNGDKIGNGIIKADMKSIEVNKDALWYDKLLFSLYFDLAEFTLELGDTIYISNKLCIYSKNSNRDDCENVSRMFVELCNLDTEIFNAMNGGIYSNKDKFSLLEVAYTDNLAKSITTHVNLIEKVYKCFKDNLNKFRYHVAHKVTPHSSMIAYDRVQKIDPSSMVWLMHNSIEGNQSRRINISANNESRLYIPQKIRSSQLQRDNDIYENQIIMGFLKHFINVVNNLINSWCFELDIAIERLNKNIPENKGDFFCPLFIIYENIYKDQKEIQKRLTLVSSGFSTLYNEYKKILRCEIKNFERLPKFTQIFQNEPHYRSIFEHIWEWCKYGDFDLNKEALFLRVKTIDKIYEYYCLSQLLTGLKEEGFRIVGSSSFEYEGVDDKYKPEKAVKIKYQFTHENHDSNLKRNLTIYYEPVISSNGIYEMQNGIDLLLVAKNSKYCLPDFLIKYQCNEKEYYAIFDSKFSRIDNIKKYYLTEILMKYYISLSKKDAIVSVSILQGRLDYNADMYDYYNEWGQANSILPIIKIYPLNPKYNQIKRIIRDTLKAFEC